MHLRYEASASAVDGGPHRLFKIAAQFTTSCSGSPTKVQ